jgi:hypothetical protein
MSPHLSRYSPERPHGCGGAALLRAGRGDSRPHAAIGLRRVRGRTEQIKHLRQCVGACLDAGDPEG